ncbi:hypothetical protein CMI41_02670 [Candidatus Pacearchaeota archaeon]|jgi:hypothetical protein|nr:hypothetical protein [Candidatus Pacearchaeota archaeon]|tara:strand:- start:16961 stop:17224 length:264 start_codon:yes stop_codon:yes gene_type:complete
MIKSLGKRGLRNRVGRSVRVARIRRDLTNGRSIWGTLREDGGFYVSYSPLHRDNKGHWYRLSKGDIARLPEITSKGKVRERDYRLNI